MKRLVAFALLTAGLLAWARQAASSPVQGSLAVHGKVGEGEEIAQKVKFKGGQRACIIVLGDRDPVVPLVLEVWDEKGKLVARDEPSKGVEEQDAAGNDVCAVIWYPPRDGVYTIKIANRGHYSEKLRENNYAWSECRIAFR